MDTSTRDALSTLFNETFFGAGNERGTWFNENVADSGICGVLDRIPAEVASRTAGQGRRSVVAHARHALVHVENVTKFIRGEKSKVDWKASFEPGTATDEEWAEMRERLRRSSQALIDTTLSAPSEAPMAIPAAIGAIAHAAYHLGAIKQIMLSAR